MKGLKLICAAFASILITSCSDMIAVTGHLQDEYRTVGFYENIVVESGIECVVVFGEENAIKVRTYSSVFEYIYTDVNKGVLYVGLDRDVKFDENPNIKVTIVTNDMKSIVATGGSRVAIDGELSVMCPENSYIELSGGSYLEGAVETDFLDMLLTGGSQARIKGHSISSGIEVSGGSMLYANEFTTSDLKANISGGSGTYINILAKLVDAYISGGSKLYYRGNPVMGNLNVTGGSTIIKGF